MLVSASQQLAKGKRRDAKRRRTERKEKEEEEEEEDELEIRGAKPDGTPDHQSTRKESTSSECIESLSERTIAIGNRNGFFQPRMSSLNYTGCPCRHGNPSARRDT
ncbi:hypothetical protein X777_10699 [Ooceraea biroi]|uniref:Uncharacterized protein n=1 Tax=Ooceraea biroi TaxID=2015173 RepID=A0A026W4I2_OOCBI|nr:hypothetical protein X777_10699 [Ooceraea biroi]